MDWLTFIAKIVEALAWPGTFLAVLLVIRERNSCDCPVPTEGQVQGCGA